MNFSEFFQLFLEQNTRHKLQGDVWQSALDEYEELRVGVELMKNINDLFPSKEIYIVGGVARDLLMGEKIDDVDLATNIPFEELSKHFELRDISKAGSQPVNKINFKNYSFDLAQFRVDSKTHGRHNNVSTITNSFADDTARRDITQNSLGLTSDGEIIDWQGGISDINNKVIRAVGNAKERFLEDASRILRIVRFAAKSGFAIEQNTKDAIIEMKDILMDRSIITNEAISKEFYKAAKSGKTLHNFLKGLSDIGILQKIMPEFHAMDGMMHSLEHHPEGGGKVIGHILECLLVSKFTDPVINLAVLFHDFGKATTYQLKDGYKHTYHGHEAAGVPIVQNIFKRMVFPDLTAEDKENIAFSTANHMLIHNIDSLNIKSLTRLVNNPGWETVKSVAYCDEAARGAPLFNNSKFEEKIQRAEEKVGKLGDRDALRKRIKEYIDGIKLLSWFPELQANRPLIGKVLGELNDYVLELLNNGDEINDELLKSKAQSLINSAK